MLAGGALALIVVTAASTSLLLNLTASPAPSGAHAEGAGQSAVRQGPVKALVAPAKEAPLSKGDRERYLSALGMLSAAHVYQTYLNIGLLADGVESGAYTRAEAEEMLTTLGGLLNQTDRQLDKIAGSGLSEDDRQSVARVRQLTALLRRQAGALRACWAGGGREQIDRYHQAREATWKNVSAVLGLD
jgi:hypothetical protein